MAHPSDHEADDDRVYRELGGLGFSTRALLLLYSLAGAYGGLYGGYLLLHETSHWAAWLVALVILEPIGVACALAVIVVLAPGSFMSAFLLGAVRRAMVGVGLVGAAFFLFIFGTLAYVAWYFLTAGR